MVIESHNIKINILTRTSNRPVGFQFTYSSIKEQSYSNIKHIVAYDDKQDLSYLKNLKIDLIDVTHIGLSDDHPETDAEGNLYAPYNLYCNELLDAVEDGWILFLDDDDSLYHSHVIQDLVDIINEDYSTDKIFIWQMRYPDGKVLPNYTQIRNEVVKKNYIGSPCYVFHSSYAKRARWDSFKASDYRFLKQLLEIIPNHRFIKKIGVQINNFGDLGRRNDISNMNNASIELPRSFYKNLIWYLIPKYHQKVFGKLVFHKNSYKRLFGISKSKSNL